LRKRKKSRKKKIVKYDGLNFICKLCFSKQTKKKRKERKEKKKEKNVSL